jgi:hypothetical protein
MDATAQLIEHPRGFGMVGGLEYAASTTIVSAASPGSREDETERALVSIFRGLCRGG